MPTNKLRKKTPNKERITITLDPSNKKHVDRRAEKESTYVSSIIDDLITQDRSKKP